MRTTGHIPPVFSAHPRYGTSHGGRSRRHRSSDRSLARARTTHGGGECGRRLAASKLAAAARTPPNAMMDGRPAVVACSSPVLFLSFASVFCARPRLEAFFFSASPHADVFHPVADSVTPFSSLLSRFASHAVPPVMAICKFPSFPEVYKLTYLCNVL